MARHAADDGAWDACVDAELVHAIRLWQASHPVPDLPAECVGGSASPYAEPALVPARGERYGARRRLDKQRNGR